MRRQNQVLVVVLVVLLLVSISVQADDTERNTKSKFYDFSEQLIDGQIRKPTNLYLDVRQRVKFDRLLRLKKSFLPKLFDTAKEKVFK